MLTIQRERAFFSVSHDRSQRLWLVAVHVGKSYGFPFDNAPVPWYDNEIYDASFLSRSGDGLRSNLAFLPLRYTTVAVSA